MSEEQGSAVFQLYVIRHAAAEEPFSSAPDSHRALTANGRERFRKTARKLARKVRSIELILTSPLVRAVQTAEILAGEIGHQWVRVLPQMAGGPAQAVLDSVLGMTGKHRSIAVVGHEPQVTELLARSLRLGPEEEAAIHFRKGTVVLVEVRGPKAEVRWSIRSGSVHPGLPEAKGDD